MNPEEDDRFENIKRMNAERKAQQESEKKPTSWTEQWKANPTKQTGVLSQIWEGSDTVTKLQFIILIPLLFIFIVIGLNYLSGNLQVERTPSPTSSEPAMVNYCSEVTGECYEPEPTWENNNEFPARP
jgi:hypothetical protein